MTREEKIKMAIEKGITCDINTGKVYGVKGREMTAKGSGGYNVIAIQKDNKRICHIYSHQFIFYKAYGRIVDCIDHINGDRADNRIENLREATQQQNQHNRTMAKGCYWIDKSKKWRSQIQLNKKTIYLGYFDKEEDAREAYLNAKKIYHII